MLAWGLLNRGDPSSALPWARRAAQNAPGLERAQYALGRALAETSDVPGGIQHLEAAARLDSTDLEVHLALASAYSNAGRTADARLERLRSIELSRGMATAAHP